MRWLRLPPSGCRRVGMPFRGIRYTDGSRSAVASFRSGTGLGVRRTSLHAALLEAAVAAGVRVEVGRVRSVTQSSSSVTAGGFTARYLVAADGLHSTVRRLVGVPAAPGARRRWGVRAHFAVAPWSDVVEVHWAREAEAYVTPVGPSCVGVAVLGSRQAPYSDLLAPFPSLAALGSPAGPVRAAGPLRQDVARRVAGRVLLVGDAAGYLDALTGEGLALSFRCAAAAVERIVAGDGGRLRARLPADHPAVPAAHVVAAVGQRRPVRAPAARSGGHPPAAGLPNRRQRPRLAISGCDGRTGTLKRFALAVPRVVVGPGQFPGEPPPAAESPRPI